MRNNVFLIIKFRIIPFKLIFLYLENTSFIASIFFSMSGSEYDFVITLYDSSIPPCSCTWQRQPS